jgi:glycine betaine/choline ABC-type transport system substrate-binding protein
MKPIRAVFGAVCLGCLLLSACAPPRPDHPVIGAKNFTEQVVIGELLAQEIEAKSHLKVERRFYLAGSYICHQALVAGRIDAYVEYTGTALTAILKQPVDRNPQSVLDTVRRLYASRYNVTVAQPLGFENTFAMIVRIIAGNSTDGPIREFGLTALQDDKHYFPPYQAVPLVRDEALKRWPQIQLALDALAGKITADDMRAMNEAVDAQHRDPAEIVREFRQSKGI